MSSDLNGTCNSYKGHVVRKRTADTDGSGRDIVLSFVSKMFLLIMSSPKMFSMLKTLISDSVLPSMSKFLGTLSFPVFQLVVDSTGSRTHPTLHFYIYFYWYLGYFLIVHYEISLFARIAILNGIVGKKSVERIYSKDKIVIAENDDWNEGKQHDIFRIRNLLPLLDTSFNVLAYNINLCILFIESG